MMKAFVIIPEHQAVPYSFRTLELWNRFSLGLRFMDPLRSTTQPEFIPIGSSARIHRAFRPRGLVLSSPGAGHNLPGDTFAAGCR